MLVNTLGDVVANILYSEDSDSFFTVVLQCFGKNQSMTHYLKNMFDNLRFCGVLKVPHQVYQINYKFKFHKIAGS